MNIKQMEISPDFYTLVELLQYRAKHQNEKKAFIFLIDGEEEGPILTYEELDRQAKAIGALLQTCTKKGDRVLLLYPPGLEFISAFFGCLYAGVMAVPAYPPKPNRPMPRLQSIISDSESTVVLTVESIYSSMEKRFENAPDLKEMKWFVTDRLEGNPEHQWVNPDVTSDTIAFLQYTSGSTAAPKGVMVSHGNLIHNEYMVEKAYQHTENTIYLSWLPLFHDMGLIGNMLQSLYLGTTCILMAPAAFLQKPYRWLKAISNYKANTSGGPNFAYDLCVKMVTPEQMKSLDLSSWTIAFNGAEPIRSSTLRQFAETFQCCGFKEEAFYPCYGLAEATLFVTGLLRKEPPVTIDVDPSALAKNRISEAVDEETNPLQFVSCGHAWLEQEVVIADPSDLTPCTEDQVGEILISGGSVAKGYWNRKEETEYTFNAFLRDGRGPFLRTGDLGFVRGKELYITGRFKDLVIIRGRNHYPQDIELTVEACHEALRQGASAAFSVDVEGEERLVVISEVLRQYRNKNLDDVLAAIRRTISENHELKVYSIVLIMPGSILKTSSGKIQRRACKAEFLKGGLDVICEWKADLAQDSQQHLHGESYMNDDMESVLIHIISSKLGVKANTLDVSEPIANYGLDSLKAIELMHSIEAVLGIGLSLNQFFECESIGELISHIKEMKASCSNDSETVRINEKKALEQPLSRGQRSIWFLQAMQPDNTAYNISKAVLIESELDEHAMERSFQRLLDRHAVLRATFHDVEGEPVQRFNKEMSNFYTKVDAMGWTEASIQERICNEAYKPFDLEKGPLFKVILFSSDYDGHKKHILMLSLHHIITDFWSLSILMQEISLLYSEEKTGVKANLAENQFDYTDFVTWQEQMLVQNEGKKLLEYWKNQLSGELPVLNLPTDRPRPMVQTYRGSSVSFKVNHETAHQLKAIAKNTGATLYMVLLASYQLLLHRYTGQQEILVGSPVAGRDKAAFSNILGYFVNPIVLRAKFTDTLTFTDFLSQVRKTVLEAYEHQNLPFANLVETLMIQRDPAYSPVFQAMFVLQKSHMLDDKGLTPFALGATDAKMQLGELLMKSVKIEQKTAQFDISAVFAEEAEGLIASLEYNTDLFDASTMERMAEHFNILLENIAKEPERDILKLELLSKKEKQQMIIDWNDTKGNYKNLCFHQLFQEQVQRTPDKDAVFYENDKLTYLELNQKANQLACYLIKQGVGPNVLVGICLPRSINMLIGLLGILKAGGTYIPLDPSYPTERLTYMVEDSKLSLLLTSEELSDFSNQLSDSSKKGSTKVVKMDAIWDQIAKESVENPDSSVLPTDLAYIIYTSGSTGKPKGVQILHKALVNFLISMEKQPGMTKDDILLSVTTLSFDIAALEVYLPLLTGAGLVLVSREVSFDGLALMEEMENRNITVMQATPATWKMLIESGWRGKKDLKVLCGGEALPESLAKELLKRCKSLWNMYGPTETTIWSTTMNIQAGFGTVSVGRPIMNTQVYILDRNMEPVPIGVTGELYIGGDGLSVGYLNRPELTREKFVPNPFSGDKDAKIYQTGDVARFLPDGNIEILGRVDHQVKIRGFRIELGEIEALLRKHPSIKEAAVVAREITQGDRQLVAYLVLRQGAALESKEIRSFLKQNLPDYMIPTVFVEIGSIPLTPNGKVDRNALPAPNVSAEPKKTYTPPTSDHEKIIADIWKEVLPVDNVGVEDNFFDLGGHSLLLSKVYNKLKKLIKKEITMVDMFKYPTVKSLAGYLNDREGSGRIAGSRINNGKKRGCGEHTELAVIGMAGRFPGAKNIDEFWNNLKEGVESIKFFTEDELKAAGISAELLSNPDYVKARAVLSEAEYFDASFFGFSPREAQILDPQHRLFLECAWDALEHAGCNPESFEGRIGVFAGVGLSHYLLNLYSENGLIDSLGSYQTFIGNDKDFVPTRVSYKLNLKGPSVNVQTACSSSLVAIHLARQSLISGECDMVLAGGVSIRTPQEEGYLYQSGGIPSPDGHCRAFDEKAQGTVFGNGVGIIALKRLEDAISDHDYIHAVIKGTALNNDGSSKIGYTAPSVEGQAEVITKALDNAGVSPDTISYIEAHGTGTPMGDPIEIAALKEAFKDVKTKEQVGVGSVKTNIGHLDTAAGAAGVIKTVLALKHHMIPPSLHFEKPNSQLGLDESPFYINHKLSKWETGEHPRRAGVSSFGIGGTNAHVVLEEGPQLKKSGSSKPWHLLSLSAKTESALENATQNLLQYIKENKVVELADIAYTLHVGRKTMSHRRAIVVKDVDDAARLLDNQDPRRVITGLGESKAPSITFMFPGQGSQYVNMAKDLYQNEPVFKETVDRCSEILTPHLGLDLRQIIFSQSSQEEDAKKLQETWLTQPSLFVIEYAMAKLLMDFGIYPHTMIGHSIGEYAAACLAGVFTLEDALVLVAARGRLMQSLPAGSMMVVHLAEDKIIPYLDQELCIAAVNGPSLCVVSGPKDRVAVLENELIEKEIPCKPLHTSHAFHSSMMDPILKEFEELVKGVQRNAPGIPFVSNLTGDWISDSDAMDPAYWVKHLREAVRFADGVKKVLSQPESILLEVGPGQTLSTLARQQMVRGGSHTVLSTLRHPQDNCEDMEYFLCTLGKAWTQGVKVDLTRYYAGENRYRIPLPTYPFERQRYLIEVDRNKSKNTIAPVNQKKEIKDWFYIPSWKKTMHPVSAQLPVTSSNCLVFMDPYGVGQSLVEIVRQNGGQAVTVSMGDGFRKMEDTYYTINPEKPEDYQKLMEELKGTGTLPDTIVHLWSITENPDDYLNMSFYSLLYLAKAIGRYHTGEPLQIAVVTNGMQKVESRDSIHPEKAAVLGPLKVIPQEYPGISTRCVDIGPLTALDKDDTAEQLVAEIMIKPDEPMVAYRGYDRWVQGYEPVQIHPANGISSRLRENGVYLITGGTGGVGLHIAQYLAKKVKARLILTGRSAFPEKTRWEQWLAEHGEDNEISIKIKKIQDMEGLGGEVLVCTADACNPVAMKNCIEDTISKFGGIHGVFHAAGLPGGGIIQLKTKESADKVLLPKLQGVQVVHSVLKDITLDLFICCSSINSIIGGFGQIDYTAANAVLDAFAQSQYSRKGTYYASINWDRWKEVGMAKTDGDSSGEQDRIISTTPINHPLLDQCTVETLSKDVYTTRFQVEKHWVLSEHTIAGIPTIPGTTYLEMARAAFYKHAAGKEKEIEIRETAFMAPLAVKEGETREALTILIKNEDFFEFKVVSRPLLSDGKASSWQEHAVGKIRSVDGEPAEKFDVETIISNCSKKEIRVSETDLISGPERFVGTGPRWNNLKKVYLGENEALTVLSLPLEFSGDLEEMKLHPAVMDVATGSVQRFIGEGNYLPLAYEKLTVKKGMSSDMLAYVRFKDRGLLNNKDTITCDISIMDAQGIQLVDITGFTMKRVNEETAENLHAPFNSKDVREELESEKYAAASTEPIFTRLTQNANRANHGGLGGLSIEEALEVLDRVLSNSTAPQMIVSTKDLTSVISSINSFNQEKIADELGAITQAKPVHARPSVKNAYIAPANDLEQTISSIWQKVLGIEQVGIHDNFFELGGTSLSGIQVVSELKKAFNKDIPTVSIFEAPTITLLAKLLSPGENQQSFDHTRDRAGKKKEALNRQRLQARERRR